MEIVARAVRRGDGMRGKRVNNATRAQYIKTVTAKILVILTQGKRGLGSRRLNNIAKENGLGLASVDGPEEPAQNKEANPHDGAAEKNIVAFILDLRNLVILVRLVAAENRAVYFPNLGSDWLPNYREALIENTDIYSVTHAEILHALETVMAFRQTPYA